MPYIPKTERIELDDIIRRFPMLSAGQKNYVITRFLLKQLPTDAGYKDYNEAMGILECVKQELYRKRIAMYENDKCESNGEVF